MARKIKCVQVEDIECVVKKRKMNPKEAVRSAENDGFIGKFKVKHGKQINA